MKRKIFKTVAIAVLAIAFAGFRNGGAGEKIIMTVAEYAKKVEIHLAGKGTAIIDWGDGSKEALDFTGKYQKVKYSYDALDQKRTITVYGTAITNLNCNRIRLTALDVSKSSSLASLYCESNDLTALDVSNNPLLKTLVCSENHLTSIDVSNNPLLEIFGCTANQITSLDISKNPALQWVLCAKNQITSLDLSNNPKIDAVDCSGNQLTSLDVSQNTALFFLSCGENQLTTLDLSKNTSLGDLNCISTRMDAEALNAMLETLPNKAEINTTGIIYIGKNSGVDDCDINIAKNKGWTVNTSNE